jgi:cytochrome c2
LQVATALLFVAFLIGATLQARRLAVAGAAATLYTAKHAHAAGDAGAGKEVFANQCASCHTTVPGKHGFGPSLAAVLGRKSGSEAGYKYSDAMANAGLTWDAATLDQFLAASTTKVPGTAMAVSLTDAKARADVIAYLTTLGAAPAASAASAATAKPAAPLGHGPTNDELARAAADKQNWLYASKDYTGQRYVDLKQITPANAGRLRAVCIYRSNTAGATQTNPLVYQGIMYFTIDQATVAIDAATCRERWTYTWNMKDGALSKANRGVTRRHASTAAAAYGRRSPWTRRRACSICRSAIPRRTSTATRVPVPTCTPIPRWRSM